MKVCKVKKKAGEKKAREKKLKERQQVDRTLKSKWLIDWQLDINLQQNYFTKAGPDV